MVGITSYGAYIPFYRLKREDIARSWGGASLGGEKAVANFDEDSVTMAVAAVLDCLGSIDRSSIDGLYFASTTSPYREKQCASIIAGAADLRREVFTGDFADTLRAGTVALRAAIDAVKAGSAKNVLVVAADCRLGAPRSEFEQVFGDGAVAFLIGDSNVAVTVEESHSHSDEIVDLWRMPGDAFVRSWEDRFINTEGYLRNVSEAITSLMRKSNLALKDMTKVIFYAPDARRHREMAASLGLDYKTQVQDGILGGVGNTGCALALMMLVSALEEAKAGDRLLLANYGDGCDAYILRVTEEVGKLKDRRGMKSHLASKRYLPSYEKYLTHRELVPAEAQRRPPFTSSAPTLWRDRKWVLGLNGAKCNNCGRLFFPPQRVCLYCRAKDNFEWVRLSDKKGTLFTFCKDNLALSPDSPEVFARVHMENGLAVYCKMTDRDPDKVEIDMPVEMTFRKFHEGGGYPNYFWKCRPVR